MLFFCFIFALVETKQRYEDLFGKYTPIYLIFYTTPKLKNILHLATNKFGDNKNLFIFAPMTTTLNTVKDLATQLMGKTFKINAKGWEYNLNALELGYKFAFNKRKCAFGVCAYIDKTIELSEPLCSVNLDKIDTQITDTILHEIAHAFCIHIYGAELGGGHDWRWRNIALQIGCNGERCYDIHEVNHTQSKYTLYCKSCGMEVPRHKKITRTQACAKCCTLYNFGRFSKDYLLEYKINY